MSNTPPKLETLAESLRLMYADGRLRELDLLNPVEELERAIAKTLIRPRHEARATHGEHSLLTRR
jgi:hypothetical protein